MQMQLLINWCISYDLWAISSHLLKNLVQFIPPPSWPLKKNRCMSKNFCQVAGMHRGLPTELLFSSSWSWDFLAGELLMAWACARDFPAAAWRQTVELNNQETPCRAPDKHFKKNRDRFTDVGTGDDFHNHPEVELASAQNLSTWLHAWRKTRTAKLLFGILYGIFELISSECSITDAPTFVSPWH